MKDLVFIGGAKGVGKSTIIDRLARSVEFKVVNTGDIYVYARDNELNPEQEIAMYLIHNHKGIVDTHYTGGYSNGNFPRGLAKKYLLNIAKVKSIDFILLDIDKETLFKRRCTSKPKKYQDKDVICLELKMNRYYFKQYCNELLISGLIIKNESIDQTINKILRRIK